MWRTRENIRVFSFGRSICPFCKNKLKWYENVPVLSWLILRAHCRICKKRIHFSYFLVEIITGALFVFAAQNFLLSSSFSEWMLFRDLCFITFLVIIFVYDLRYGEVLLSVIFAGVVIGFLINIFALRMPVAPMLIGAGVSAAFFYFQYLISNGKWIGAGDAYIGVMAGIWLGWPNIVVALFLAYIFGGVVSALKILFGNMRQMEKTPFGVYFATAIFIVLYWGENITNYLLNIF
jgi:leader peptidase (prepilin peptidase)/N-methyltransferase